MQFDQFVLTQEPIIRLSLFLVVFALIGAWEVLAPQRSLTVSKSLRWRNNLALVVLNTGLLRLLFPMAAVGVAAYCAAKGWGVLNRFHMSTWIAVPFCVIAMDLVIWLQHVVFHAVPAMWRLHRVHHADLDYDLSRNTSQVIDLSELTTGSRFHPVEIVLSMLVKFVTIAILGAPVLAVMIFELVLSAAAMFNHGNMRLPASLDRMLRWVIITPDMHRVHHSVELDETNSNFGFNLAWWDRLLGTYREQPRAGQIGMTIGVRGHTDEREVVRLDGILLMPFKAEIEGSTVNPLTSTDRTLP